MTATSQKPVIHRADLAIQVSAKFGCSKTFAQSATQCLIDALAAHLRAGDTVHIRGLGRFDPVATAPRQGRNPKTGEAYPIPARRRVKFRPAAVLRGLSVEEESE